VVEGWEGEGSKGLVLGGGGWPELGGQGEAGWGGEVGKLEARLSNLKIGAAEVLVDLNFLRLTLSSSCLEVTGGLAQHMFWVGLF
jgi:hypothetical protein